MIEISHAVIDMSITRKIINKGDEILLFVEGIYIKQTTYISMYDFKKLNASCGSFLCVFCLFSFELAFCGEAGLTLIIYRKRSKGSRLLNRM